MRFKPEILGPVNSKEIEDFYNYPEKNEKLIIDIKLKRFSDFWSSLDVYGHRSEVFVVRDMEKQKIAFACIISTKKCYIQGDLYEVGYVSGLKAHNEYKGSRAFATFLQCFKEYSKSLNTTCWYFSVLNDNTLIHELIAKKRFLLPFIKKTIINNAWIFTSRSIKLNGQLEPGIKVQFAKNKDLEEVLKYWKKNSKSFDLLPDYSLDEFAKGKGLLKEFNAEDLVIAKKNDEIIGVMGIWNQTNFRSWIINNYSQKIIIEKPFYNLYASLLGKPKLPAVGCPLVNKLICLPLVGNSDLNIYQVLLQKVLERQNKETVMSIGIPEGHPINNLFEKKCKKVQSVIYLGYWEKNSEIVKKIKNQNIYIELGGL